MNSYNQVMEMYNTWMAAGLLKTEVLVKFAEALVGWPYAWGATGQKCTVKNREARMKNSKISQGDINLIKKRCQILNGKASSCTGCKYYPDDFTEIHDCIGFVNACLDRIGVYHYGAGCTFMWNHTKNWALKGKLSEMPETVCLVFQQRKGEPNKMEHIGIYIGDGWVIHCSVEVKKQKLSEYPWTHFGILNDMGGDVPVIRKTIKRGSSGENVVYLQEKMIELGYDLGAYGADGKFGAKTEAAVRDFQSAHGLKTDGIVGRDTWTALDEACPDDPKPEPEPPVEKLYTVTIQHLDTNAVSLIKTKYPEAKVTEE